MMFTIYRIRNLTNGKEYIGKTSKKLEDRMARHLKGARRNEPMAISRAIRKYGERNFRISSICSCESEELANRSERFCIAYWKTKTPLGYNLTDGGDGIRGIEFSEERRRRISEVHKGNTYCRGRKLTEDQKHRISEGLLRNPNIGKWNIGRKHSEETKHKFSIAHKGKKHSESWRCRLGESLKKYYSLNGHPRLGYKHSEETKRKISEAHKGKKFSEEHLRHMREVRKGKPLGPHSEETRRKISKANKGRIFTEEWRRKISEAKKGKSPWNKGTRRPNGTKTT